MPTEPIKDYPIAKSLCQAGTPALLVDRRKSVAGGTSGGGGRVTIGATKPGGGVRRTPWAGTTGTIGVGCIPRRGEPAGGSAGGGAGPDSVTGLTGPLTRPGSRVLSAADVISSRYWWKPRIATGISALDSGKLSAAISSNVRISSLLLMASLTRSHVTDCSDSSPAAHQARSPSSTSSATGPAHRMRDSTSACALGQRKADILRVSDILSNYPAPTGGPAACMATATRPHNASDYRRTEEILITKAHRLRCQWGHCTGEECGSGGLQTRTLWCVHTEGWTTHHSHCPQADKPASRRPCFRVCEWHQDLFEWEVSPWGGCFLAPFLANELRPRPSECVTAQHGVQRRSVRCVRTANRTAVATRICEFFSGRPWAEQACLIPCPQDCVVSAFTAWSGCSRTCGAGLQHRTRHVLATPVFGGAHCPNLTQTRTCSHPTPCPPGASEHRYSLKVGSWSECRPPHHKDPGSLGGKTAVDYSATAATPATPAEKNLVKRHAQDPLLTHLPHPHHQHHRSQNLHGQHHHHHHHHLRRLHHLDTQPHPFSGRMSWELEVGYQTRQVRCTRSDGKNSMLSLCTQDDSPLTFQSCVMPKDCETSDWSSWSPCSKTCRSSDLSPGYRVRARTMAQIPIGGGKGCPTLEEKEACNIIGDLLPNCPRFVWRTTDWGLCRVSPLLGPHDRRAGNTSVLCGGGIHTREVYCVQVPDPSAPHHRKEVSRPVSAGLCAGEEPPSVVQLCSLPCPQPCLLSPWSAWEACLPDSCPQPQESQLKKGFRHRRRRVLWEPADLSSKTCPHLLESAQCEEPSCYLWRARPLEDCVPGESACGPGTARQNVTCVDTE
ncbi:unnamed protein product, partial [Boreogadus saida]